MMPPIETTITYRRTEAENIFSLELRPVGASILPAFAAGAHLDVRIPGTDLVRQYSLLNDPQERDRYVLAIQREQPSRGGSEALFQQAFPGQTLWVSPPKNRFSLVAEAKRHVLIAGGIGITPLLSMAKKLHRQQASFELHYSTTTRDRAAFYHYLQQEAPFASQVHFYHDDYKGHLAFSLRMALEGIDPHAQVYVCGPATLIRATLAGARVVGLPEEQVHYEYFSLDGLEEQRPSQENKPFEIVLARQQKRLQVGSEQTIVEVVQQAGVDILVSCQEGICGTCVTPVLEGVPDHRDHYLTRQEKNSQKLITACCSRAHTRTLVLDI